MCQKASQVSEAVFRKTAEIGIRMTRLRYRRVKPRDRPKPGRTLPPRNRLGFRTGTESGDGWLRPRLGIIRLHPRIRLILHTGDRDPHVTVRLLVLAGAEAADPR